MWPYMTNLSSSGSWRKGDIDVVDDTAASHILADGKFQLTGCGVAQLSAWRLSDNVGAE